LLAGFLSLSAGEIDKVLSELDSGQTDVVYYNNENEIGAYETKVP
jgi:hypothetical protein